MKANSYFLLLLLIAGLSLAPTKAKATHAAGGELIYEWISDSTYRFFFKFYRDCTGAQEPDITNTLPTLCARNSCDASWNQDPIMPKWTGSLTGGTPPGTEVSPGCSQYPTKCINPGSIVPGYKEWWYSTIIVLGGRCNFWTFSVIVNARNPSVNTNNASGGNLYLETTFNNLFFQGNSSPYFTIKPTSYVCANTSYTYNNGAIDPNGDSLVSEVVQPQNTNCGATPASFVGMSPGITYPSNPLPSSNSFVMNAQTGQMSFTPTQQGVHTLTTRVREYRNKILIGHIMRDVQIAVLPCNPAKPKLKMPGPIAGGHYNDTTVFGCPNQPLSFCFDAVVDSPDYVLVMGDNHAQALPNATTAYYNQREDSVRGCFSWTPSVADTGLKGFIVTVKDSTCLPPGIMLFYTFSIPIYIWAPTRALRDTSICPRQTAYLAAIGGKNFVWDVLPGGDPVSTLSCNNCPQPIASPGIPTTYHVVSTINPYCHNSNKDTVTVNVLPAPVFTPHNDTTTCPNNPVKMDLKPNAPTGVTYTYKWFPSTYLDNDAISAPISNPTTDITYYVSVKTSNSVCETRDTVKVDVLDGFFAYNNDTAICDGQSVEVNGVGDQRYTYKWELDPQAQANISNDASLITTITPGKVGKFSYILRAKYATCLDSTYTFTIETQPIPDVTVNDDTKICFGDTMKLNGLVTPADYKYDLTWTPGSALDDAKTAAPIFTASAVGDAELTLTARSSANCADSDKVKLTVFPAKFLAVSNDTSICSDDSIKLNLTAEGVKSFKWYPDVNISNTVSLDPIVWPTTSQTYSVYGLDTNGCTDTQSVSIRVNPRALLDIPRKLTLYPGQQYELNPGGNCLYYSWYPSLGLNNDKISNPILMPKVNTRYIVNASTEAGCATTDSIDVMIMPDTHLDIPNAFTPGSGPNGKLKIVHLGAATLKNFSVYNRWGTKVFETTNLNEGWDGQYKSEPQPMGAYIYTIEAITPAGRTFTKHGNVTLLR